MTTSGYERELVTAGDGRVLEVYLSGAPDGTATVFHNGTPSAGVPFQAFSDLAAERGLRLITYARPGYAGSSRHAGRSVADVAADAETILQLVAADRCYTLGWSGGGPHALATAALMPDRVIAAATIAGVAPYPADGLDWMAGMGEENLQEFGAAMVDADQLRAFLEREGSEMAHITPDSLVAGLGDLISKIDAAALTGEYAEWLAATFRASVSTGIWGWYDDDVAFVHPWGFDIGAIHRPVAIWQGETDRMVPFAHGEWLASHVGSARPHLLPEHGHLSLAVASMAEIFDDLVAIGRDSA